MIYERLNDIPLYVFNKILLGDIDAVVINGEHTKEEKELQSEALINEYFFTIGDKTRKQTCILYEEALNMQRFLMISNIGINMLKNDINVSLEAARYLKYNGEKEGVKNFLESQNTYYKQRFDLCNLRIKEYKKNNKNDKKLTEQDLADERAALMIAGIQINQYKISAMEYACIIKAKMKEAKAIKSKLKNKK